MIKSIQFQEFLTIPYLNDTGLLRAHEGVISLSTDKPNIIVGPNGSGKSSLIRALALRTLSFINAKTEYAQGYVEDKCDDYTLWGEKQYRWNDEVFLPGMVIDGDVGPAMYYEPDIIPGRETSIAHAMMLGFFNEAREYAQKTRGKSSGEKSLAVMAQMMAFIRNPLSVDVKMPENVKLDNLFHNARRNALCDLAESMRDHAPFVLMDEPEKSLDALNQIEFWRAVKEADCKKVQIVIATHSLVPFLDSDSFNIIESEKGYLSKAKSRFDYK